MSRLDELLEERCERAAKLRQADSQANRTMHPDDYQALLHARMRFDEINRIIDAEKIAEATSVSEESGEL